MVFEFKIIWLVIDYLHAFTLFIGKLSMNWGGSCWLYFILYDCSLGSNVFDPFYRNKIKTWQQYNVTTELQKMAIIVSNLFTKFCYRIVFNTNFLSSLSKVFFSNWLWNGWLIMRRQQNFLIISNFIRTLVFIKSE